MLVEFTRVATRNASFSTENEDGLPSSPSQALKCFVNPLYIGSVFDHQTASQAVIRMADGRGLLVQGTAAEAEAKIKKVIKGFKYKTQLLLPAPGRDHGTEETDEEATLG
jgi:hypothetical protein